MIRYLRGTILTIARNQIIVDVHGVGYNIFATATSLTQAQIGQEAEYHLSESVREDAYDLFGFTSPYERDLFEQLRKVPGVGPKVALAICGFYNPTELAAIVQSSDAAKLSLVPGIGKKMAEKIILELKGKLTAAPETISTPADPDMVDALQSLGYSPAEIAKVLPQVPAGLASSEERIAWVLRHMAE